MKLDFLVYFWLQERERFLTTTMATYRRLLKRQRLERADSWDLFWCENEEEQRLAFDCFYLFSRGGAWRASSGYSIYSTYGQPLRQVTNDIFFEAYRLEYPRARVAGRFVLFDKIYDQFVDDDDVFYYFIFHDLTSRQRRLSATFSFWLCKTGFGFCVSWRRRWPTGPMMIKKTYYFYPRT